MLYPLSYGRIGVPFIIQCPKKDGSPAARVHPVPGGEE